MAIQPTPSPAHMTTEQRLREVAQLLALGLIRARQDVDGLSVNTPVETDISLAITGHQSVHRTHTTHNTQRQETP